MARVDGRIDFEIPSSAKDRDVEQRYQSLRVGLAGLGLEAYWSQFDGLQDRLAGYLNEVERRIERDARVIVNLGLIDSPEKSVAAGHACRTEDVDLLLVYVTTYALSSTVLPLVLRAKVPVVLLNLQPSAAIDYAAFNRMRSREAMTGEWLAYCGACPVPEIANVLMRLTIPFHQVTGTLRDDDGCWPLLEEWLRAAEVAHLLRHSRLGLMGHYYGGMLDIATDLTQVSGRFGIHIEMLEVEQLSALRRTCNDAELEAKVNAFEDFFEIGAECSAMEVGRAARTAVALDKLVALKSLDLMAYFYNGTGAAESEDTMSSIILGSSLLTGQGIPVAGEYEVKNAVAMKIMDLLGCGGSFTEFYAVDYEEDVVLMGHDGPGHVRIAQDRIKVRPLEVYHGKAGRGLSVEMSVKHGPVTLLSVVEHAEKGFTLLVAEGESCAGEVLEIGNTNSRYRFSIGARRFIEAWNAEGPAHHCAVGTGHLSSTLSKLAKLLDLNFASVCYCVSEDD
jgi:L-arabinose isomerase